MKDRNRCWDEPYGCLGNFPDAEMGHKVQLCRECALAVSRKLRVSLADLPLALFAARQARAGRPDLVPGELEVWQVLDKLNAAMPAHQQVRQQDRYIHVPRLPRGYVPADSSLPEGDRSLP